MRDVDVATIQQMFAQEARDVIATLVVIEHPNLVSPKRYVNDNVQWTFSGYTYDRLPFKFYLAKDLKDKPPVAKVRLDNINRDLIAEIRSTTDHPTLTARVCRKNSSDGSITVVVGPITFRMDNITYDAATLKANLGFEADFLNEAATADIFAPFLTPGLY